MSDRNLQLHRDVDIVLKCRHNRAECGSRARWKRLCSTHNHCCRASSKRYVNQLHFTMVCWISLAGWCSMTDWSLGPEPTSLRYLQVIQMLYDGISLDTLIFWTLQPKMAKMRLWRKRLRSSIGMSYHPLRRFNQWRDIWKTWVRDSSLLFFFPPECTYRFWRCAVQGNPCTRPARGCCIWNWIHNDNAQCTDASSLSVPETHQAVRCASHPQKTITNLIRLSQQGYKYCIQLHWKRSERIAGRSRLKVFPHQRPNPPGKSISCPAEYHETRQGLWNLCDSPPVFEWKRDPGWIYAKECQVSRVLEGTWQNRAI